MALHFRLTRPRFFRRQTSGKSAETRQSSTSSSRSTYTTATSATLDSRSHSPAAAGGAAPPDAPVGGTRPGVAKLKETSEKSERQRLALPEVVEQQDEPGTAALEEAGPRRSGSETLAPRSFTAADAESKTPSVHANELRLDKEDVEQPIVVVQQPTPDVQTELSTANPFNAHDGKEVVDAGPTTRPRSSPSLSPRTRPSDTHTRRQSIVNSANAKIVRTLIDVAPPTDSLPTSASTALPTAVAADFFTPSLPNMASMMNRKIWVRRPGASATLVQIREDDLVDDVRDMILRKYANSLGKTFDAPDMTLRISQRVDQAAGQRPERVLGPDEEMCRTIDAYYPAGQTVEDALLIDVPHKRTPRPSPRAYQQNNYHAMDDHRPLENGSEYFPPMPAMIHPTMPQTAAPHDAARPQHLTSVAGQGGEHHRSMSVLNTGQVPPLPSPGAVRRHRDREHRPRMGRQHTTSPTILSHNPAGATATTGSVATQPQLPNAAHLVHRASARPSMDSDASNAHQSSNGIPVAPPLPSPPAPEAPPTNRNTSTPSTPLGGVSTHPHRNSRSKKPRKLTPDKPWAGSRRQQNGASPAPPTGSSVLNGSVPPINVLIVEDNSINLRILEGLMKRLKVRWQTAMNGQIAVDKWRVGGFHLVLMDIQMPVMNGLAATKEIRRLERVNRIGVFSSSTPTSPVERLINGNTWPGSEAEAQVADPKADKLQMAEGLFKSPVIIVALTASSLQSDRHEALAAGCNDFLTKPVNFVWLERKVKEWGCMQALIDFDGWRRWKEFAEQQEKGKSEEEKRAEAEKEEKQKVRPANP